MNHFVRSRRKIIVAFSASPKSISCYFGPASRIMLYQRNLPHILPPAETVFITFRLADSLPAEVMDRLREEKEMAERQLAEEEGKVRQQALRDQRKQHFARFDSLLDKAASGPLWLRQLAVAAVVKEALHFRDGKSYQLLCYCIMPNHVHLLVTLPEQQEQPFYKVLQAIKRHTAIEINKLLNRQGQRVWQQESFDHVIRDGKSLSRVISYILENPVKAGLCKTWQEWPHTWLYDEGTSE